MLAIHRSDELSTVQFGRVEDRQGDIGREEFLGDCVERALLDG
jgi:hypothetical protein